MLGTAIYAGTFDPLTLGHLDIIERSAQIFDTLILAVAEDTSKDTLFSTEERVNMGREVCQDMPSVKVEAFAGLLIAYCRSKNVRVMIRGLRAYSDFEYEFQMALTNRKMAPEIETLFLMPNEIHSYVSSSTVRKVSRLGGDTSDFVPPAVNRALREKLAR